MPNPTPSGVTATRRLADTLLDGKLDEYVRERREAGRSWRLISRDVFDDIRLDITDVTLRSWYPELRGSDDKQAS